jgi:hypothetical protein
VAVEVVDSVRVELPEPGAVIAAGLKEAVTPDGSPVALRETALLKPPDTVVVTIVLPVPPWGIDKDVGAAAIAKSGGRLTVNATVAVCVTPPPAPVTVTV